MANDAYPHLEQVVLVDQQDRAIGLAEKIEAHAKNLLHRAFSVFILRKEPQLEILLQQRALHKYHSPGLWTNTCCSHPRAEEDIIAAGKRRLQEEMGMQAQIHSLGKFHYNVHFDNGLSENEIDHVLLGIVPPQASIIINPQEVNAYRWISLPALAYELENQPEQFTQWLQHALPFVLKHLPKN